MNGISFRRLDWGMLATILTLLSLSVAFVYSAQFRSEEAVGDHYLRQLVFAGMGLVVYFGATWLDYSWLKRHAWWIYGAAMALLALVFLFPALNGAHRWIPLPGFTAQPSEIAKIATIVALSAYLASPSRDVEDRSVFWGCAGIVALPFLLIAAEPDLSTALTLAPIALAIMLHVGVRRKVLLGGMAATLIVAAGVCLWVRFERTPETDRLPPDARPGVVLPRMPFLADYQKERIRVFLSPRHDRADAGWNKLQAQIAVGSGGLTGKGYLKGTQNLLGFLPRTVAPSDFIFCVVAEETGFVGGALIILLYAVLFGRCTWASVRARDEFGRLMTLGIGIMLFCHVFVNVAMTIGLLPITGLPLPLMSYGGSFMVSTMLALGLVQSTYQRRGKR